MAHIAQEMFYQWEFEERAASLEERAHLQVCTACQTQAAAVSRLAQELAIARASTPSPAALARYDQLFAQVAQTPPLHQRLATFVRAHLQWDGRQQPAWQGVRSGQAANYRLLYGNDIAEIELFILSGGGSLGGGSANRQCHLEGEVIPLQEEAGLLPALVELQAADGSPWQSAETKADGRFQMAQVPIGHYQLFLIPPSGAVLVIDDLELF